ncbi:HEPN domain-containing protein [Rhizobium skierniewicense]|uniref:HEPN domain-containing protein n=1 Tax=Rhizobium skierniewicense TaxID=984260 RepID=UPI001571ED89|nr:HEPN domain-containing protein [Rhizobium skierniewicense]NTF33958.1 HEPN domain-containing protein [Rhizobium skierniewicense]
MEIDGLSHLPEKKRRELHRVAQIIFEEFDESLKTKLSEKAKRGRILKLILFGSYARGNWVEDRKSGYLSDYDLLIVVNHEQFAERYEAWEKAAARFVQAFDIAGHLSAPVNFIVHSYEEVNSLLARGWPFFVDIARDGIPLYDAPGHPLASPKNLTSEEVRAEAQKHFDHWFLSAAHRFELAMIATQRDFLKEAVFDLHQTAERLYHCVLNVISLYSPKSHKLTFLRSQADRIAPELGAVWPDDTKFAKRCFSRLERAYVDARYSPSYEITDEELAWLAERVKLLQDVVLAVCERALKPSI